MKLYKTLFWTVLVFMLISCQKKDKYRTMVEDGMASKIQYDSLFLGLYFGMDKQDFYEYCAQKNKEKVFFQNQSLLTVQYVFDEPFLRFPLYLDFYPNFEHNKIVEMPMRFSYQHFSHFNKEMNVDSLLKETVSILEGWYGKGFHTFYDKKGRKTLIKVNGNLHIKVQKHINDFEVEVWLTDLRVKNPLEVEKPVTKNVNR